MPLDIYAVDAAMLKADGTKDKSNLGAANAILAVSIACVRARPPMALIFPCTASYWRRKRQTGCRFL